MYGQVVNEYTFYTWKINPIQYTLHFLRGNVNVSAYIILYQIWYNTYTNIIHIYNIYTNIYIMMYFITNSKLLCEIKSRKLVKENLENSLCDHFIYIRFYNWMCVCVTSPKFWNLLKRLYCRGLNVDGTIYRYMCFLKYRDKHNNVDDIVVNHVFTICENFIKGVKSFLFFE